MKYKVHFDFPVKINDKNLPSTTVLVDFPQIPRPGDCISSEDKDFAPLFKEIDEYFRSFSTKGMYFKVPLNSVNNVCYENGEPVIVVGMNPEEVLIQGADPEDDIPVFVSSRHLPRIGDLIFNEDWYVTAVNIINAKHVWVALDNGNPNE